MEGERRSGGEGTIEGDERDVRPQGHDSAPTGIGPHRPATVSKQPLPEDNQTQLPGQSGSATMTKRESQAALGGLVRD